MASCLMAYGQRTYRFERADRLFQEGKAFFELRNFPGCSDKLMAFKAISHDRDLIQEADYMLAVVASEQGRSWARITSLTRIMGRLSNGLTRPK